MEAETMRGKDYIRMTNQIITKGNGWKGLKNFSELWLLFPGFEIARNYYQIQKSVELIKNELSIKFNKNITLKVFSPDLLNQNITEISFDKIYNPTFKITARSKAVHKTQQKPKLGFEKVKGLKEEKQRLSELKALSESNTNIGIGGILLYGLPGCGKTHLAKSFAEELGWNFYSFSPADITSMWIGQGQQNVKDIFKQAKAKSPAILFIDELEAVAFSREVNTGFGAHSDQKATINQLLVEMNNIDEHQVLVIGATNFIKGLDPAIRRTGRFDLKIPIFPPNYEERKEIIRFYLDKLNAELSEKQKQTIILTNDDLDLLADKTKQFSSSDIEAIFNQPRIDLLLDKANANTIERLLSVIEEVRNFGLSINKNQVLKFIEECEQDQIKSHKLEQLKQDWEITTSKIGFSAN